LDHPLDKGATFVAYTSMTTRLALILLAFIIGFFVLDAYVLHLNAGLFLAKKGMELINYMAIWR
jgi:hypothetical protein